MQEVRGDEAVVFARSTYASGQRFRCTGVATAGATLNRWPSLRGGLSLTACGFAFWSHDIGGFEGKPPPALYKRWIQFGLMSSHSRLHGSSSYRVPWLVDEESCDVLRAFTRLKHRLMPYLFGVARGHADGRARHACHGHRAPAGPRLRHARPPVPPRQPTAGGARLHRRRRVDFTCPIRRAWTHLLSGAKRAGDRWHQETHDFLSMPLYVAPGSVIPGVIPMCARLRLRPRRDAACLQAGRRRCGRLRRPRARRQHRAIRAAWCALVAATATVSEGP